MTFLYDRSIEFANTPDLTSFGRLRTANARLLGDYRYMYGEGTSIEMNDKIVGAGTLTPDFARNCNLATVTTAAGDRVIRQTKQYHPYIPGTSNLSMLTFTLNQAKVNLRQSVGAFDDFNGIFFRMNGLVPEFVIRKQGVDSQVVSSAEWNETRFDGTRSRFNPNGLSVDWTKSQILALDYNWLGLGRVRVGFIRDGDFVVAHNFEHTNSVTEPYMNQPSLPLRWEIENVGVTASASTLMMICGAAYCEGSEYETGFSRAISTDGTAITLTAANSANGYGILAIRLRNELVGKQSKAFARLKAWALLSNNDAQYKIVILPGASYLGVPGQAWTRVPGFGWCEYIKNFTLSPTWNSLNDYGIIVDEFVSGASGNSSGQNAIRQLDNRSNAIYQNYDSTDSQIMAIIGYRITTDAVVKANLSWLEIK